MNYEESCEAIRKKLATLSDTNAEDWHLCLKARFGMALVFEAIRDVLGDGEVITTPYTCITSINPIPVAGLTPVYHDIDKTILSTGKPDDKLCKGKAKAIVMQHTLGIVSDKVANQAKERKVLLIEDSAHALLRFAKSQDGQILVDISAHSFGVEKIIPGTKFGGAIYLNPRLETERPALYAAIVRRLGLLPTPDKSLARRIKHYRTCNAILQRTPQNIRPTLRSFAIKAKILEPAVYPFEQEAQQADSNTTNEFVNYTILKNIKNLKQNYARRLASVKYYQKHLKSENFEAVIDEPQPLLAYPITFNSPAKAAQVYDILMSSGFFIRRWYTPLLYPGPQNNRKYCFNPQKTPIAEQMSVRTISLPTDLPNSELAKIVKILADSPKLTP
jgi:dTDP-4-amino-4,6-dideoxygalactose transaminase